MKVKNSVYREVKKLLKNGMRGSAIASLSGLSQSTISRIKTSKDRNSYIEGQRKVNLEYRNKKITESSTNASEEIPATQINITNPTRNQLEEHQLVEAIKILVRFIKSI